MKKILLSALIIGCLTSSQAALFQYSVALDGPTEPSPSLGIGTGTVNYDNVTHSLQIQVSFSGLTNNLSGTTSSHIHAATVSPFSGTAGVATTTPTFVGFPSGVFSGSFSNTLDLTTASSWNNAFVNANGGTLASAELALASAMASGRAYWNIHSAAFPSGEIRGFLVPVPEPSTIALGGMGALLLAGRIWKKRRTDRS